jgi:hypothetical protein
LSIDKTGRLLQEVRVANPANSYRDETLCELARVSLDDLAALRLFADRIGFRRFRPWYSAGGTDLPTQVISIRFEDFVKQVEAHGADFIADAPSSPVGETDQTDMRDFVELWERMHNMLPTAARNHHG